MAYTLLKDGILDLSSATKFEDVATNGYITIIRSTSGDRTKLSKGLLKSIGKPNNKSTRTGNFTVEMIDETISATVISFDNSPAEKKGEK